jgi:5-aminopentanamidase
MRVAAARIVPKVGDLEGNRALSAVAIAEAAEAGARLIVLPELANSGYMFADREEAVAAAEPLDGPTVALWRELAERHDVVVVGGLCELDDEGALRNTAVVVDSAGLRAAYRKLHLWAAETELFVAGDEPAPVVDTAVGRIGLAICYDLWFPEQTRALALAGADILAIPANLTDDPAQEGLPHIDVITAIATAHLNRVHLVLCDRGGHERGHDYLGAAVVVDAAGQLLAGPPPGREAALAIADIDVEAARDKRWGPYNDLIGDRRPAHYGPLGDRAAETQSGSDCSSKTGTAGGGASGPAEPGGEASRAADSGGGSSDAADSGAEASSALDSGGGLSGAAGSGGGASGAEPARGSSARD